MKYDKEAISDLLEQVEQEGNPKIFPDLVEALKVIQYLPPSWEVLRNVNQSRRQTIDTLWGNLADKLPLTLKMLERKLVGFGVLVTDSAQPSLLYFFDEGRDLMARRGFWPITDLPEVSKNLTTDISSFYFLHDGWVNVFSGEGGPLPTHQWKIRGKTQGVKGFLEVYTKGSQALGFDLDEQPARAFSMDTDDDDVEPVESFWLDLDERLALGLKSFPDAK
jgi:hypothetical protein